MDKEPSLRKKHQAGDKNKDKQFIYTNKHVRLNESLRGRMVQPKLTKKTNKQ